MIANANRTDFLSIGQACREFGLSAPTLRNLLDSHPELGYVSVGKHRRASRRALMAHLHLCEPDEQQLGKVVCVMTRISTPIQKTSLANQKESCLAYCAEHLPGLPIEINESVRSGMHVGHEKFVDFVLNLCAGRYSHVVANHTERICRSSLPLVRSLCEKFGVELHIVNRIDDKDADDFVADILAYTMYYNAKYNSSKSAKLSRIEVSENDLVRIYQQYKQGMSYKDLSIWCETQGIVGTKNGQPQKLSPPKLHQILTRNFKVLSEIVPDVSNDIDDFIKEHLRHSEGSLTKQVAIYDAYVTWTKTTGKSPLSAKKLGLALKQAGYVSGKGLGGMKCWRNVVLK